MLRRGASSPQQPGKAREIGVAEASKREAVPGDPGGHRRAHAAEPGEADAHRAHGGPSPLSAASRTGAAAAPWPAAVFRCDWLSRTVLSAPPAVQYFGPATRS